MVENRMNRSREEEEEGGPRERKRTKREAGVKKKDEIGLEGVQKNRK